MLSDFIMRKLNSNKQSGKFEKLAAKITSITGSTPAFLSASTLILLWLISGPFFNFSETWQLIINTSTTIITFLMVFLIQKAQNKDSLAIQLKLNELVAANEFTSNRLVSVEDLTEEELKTLKAFYIKLAILTKEENSLHESHSLDEATKKHEHKKTVK